MDGSNIAVDDLFNEEELEHAALNIPISTNDVTEPQVQSQLLDFRLRLDQLHRNGCRQNTAWSRLGCVATISEDSQSVDITSLRLNRKTGVWELSSKYQLEFPPNDGSSRAYIHLVWSTTATDLAIFDNRGRLTVFGMSGASAVNRFNELRPSNLDQGDELNQVVGAFWLPASDREGPMVTQLSKQDGQWSQIVTKRKPFGPVWPRAVLSVTRIGALRIHYMKPDRSWSETNLELGTVASTKNLLTHAAFASNPDGTILMTTHDTDRRISVYSLTINRPDMQGDGANTIPITLHLDHIKSNVYNGRLSSPDGTGDLMNGASTFDPDISEMSHMAVIPTTDLEKAVQILPTIFAVSTTFSPEANMRNNPQPRASIIRRWSLYTVEQKLHPRFDEITNKAANTANPQAKPVTDLQRLPDVSFDQIITSFHLVDNNQALAVTTHDGTTSFFNPTTMSQLFYESEPKEATSMSQSGFAFPPTPFPFTIAFSSNACATVAMDPESKLHLSTMEHHSGLQTESTDSNLDAALAALVLTYTRACYSGTNTDDLVTCILNTVRRPHFPALMLTMTQTLFRDGDLIPNSLPGSEIDKLSQKLLVPKILSLHAALGYADDGGSQGRSPTRTVAGRYAWMTLNVRHVAMQLFYVVGSAKFKEPFAPDLVEMACSGVRWAMDLFRMIADELFEASDEAEGLVERRSQGGEEQSLSIRPLVELLLTGLWSRYFLKMIEKVLKMLVALPHGAAGSFVPIARTIERMQGSGLKLAGLGRLLEAADRFAESGGATVERELLASGKIAVVGSGIVGRLVKEVLPLMRQNGEVDRLGLYTGEYQWVFLEPDGGRVRKNMDIHRKTSIPKGLAMGEIRRCVRCGSLSEDVNGPKRDWPKWIQQQMMRCVCEAGFVIEPLED